MAKRKKLTVLRKSLIALVIAIAILITPFQAFAFWSISSVHDNYELPCDDINLYFKTIDDMKKDNPLMASNILLFYDPVKLDYYTISYPCGLANPDVNLYIRHKITGMEQYLFHLRYDYDTSYHVTRWNSTGIISEESRPSSANNWSYSFDLGDSVLLAVYFGDGKNENELIISDLDGNLERKDLSHIRFEYDRVLGKLVDKGTASPNPDTETPVTPPVYDDSNLIDKITKGFESIKIRFQELSDNARVWFNNLLNSISEFNASVSNYFNDLGLKIKHSFDDLRDKVSFFFEDLKYHLNRHIDAIKTKFDEIGNNISSKFNDIKISIETKIQDVKDWFSSLFTVSDGYFDNYKAKWEAWFKEHLGFLYEAGTLGVDMIKQLFGFVNTPPATSLHIPSIKLPFSQHGADQVLVQAQDIDLDSIFKAGILKTIFTMYQTAVTATFYYLLYNLARRKFDEFLAEREL